MSQVIETVYRNGAFVPQTPVNIPEGTLINVVVENDLIEGVEPVVKNAEERKRLLTELVQRMSQRTIAPDAPRRFTREELHERR